MSVPLTTLLNIKYPIVNGAMRGAAGGRLAAEVSKAGGFGFIAWNNESVTPGVLISEIDLAKSLLPTPSSSTARLPFGVGFLCWALEVPECKGSEAIDSALEARVKAVWLSSGDWEKWALEIRKRETAKLKKLNNEEEEGLKIFLQVGDVADAKRAAESGLVDVIVVQGHEAGGHGLIASIPLPSLLPAVISSLPSESLSRISIIAAGGLMLGSQLASILTLGAAGAVFGTRFLLTPEALLTEKKRNTIAMAQLGSTERSDAWDLAGIEWPAGFDGRGLSNLTSAERSSLDTSSPSALQELKARYSQAVKEADFTRASVLCGAGTGLVHQVKPAGEVVLELVEEARIALKKVVML